LPASRNDLGKPIPTQSICDGCRSLRRPYAAFLVSEENKKEAPMADVVMVLTIVVAMAAMFAFAAWLDRI